MAGVRSRSKQILVLLLCLACVRYSVQEPNRFCGDSSCCLVLSNGGVKCWGYGDMLGIEMINQSPQDAGDGPFEMGDNLTYAQLGTGRLAQCTHASYNVNCAIMENGALKCWGDSHTGYADGLSRGGYLSRTCSSTCSNPSSCAISSEYLQDVILSQPSLSLSSTCYHACNASGWCAMDAAAYSNVDCCGCAPEGFDFSLGHQTAYENQCQQGTDLRMGDNLPEVDVGTGRTVLDVASNDGATCALTDDHKVKCWGYSDYLGVPALAAIGNDIGDGPFEMGDNLTAIDFGTDELPVQIAGSYYNYHFCAVFTNGGVKCWAECSDGCLGYPPHDVIGDDIGESGENLPFVDLGPGTFATQISLGADHTCAVFLSGKVKCWGSASSGQLGLGDVNSKGDDIYEMGTNLSFVDLGPEFHAIEVCAGYDHSCAVSRDGRVKCWGSTENLGLGLDGTGPTGYYIGDEKYEMGTNLSYVDLGTGLFAEHISCAEYVTCVVFSDGRVKCFGTSGDRLGVGDNKGRGAFPGEMGDNLPFLDFGTGLTVAPCGARNTTNAGVFCAQQPSTYVGNGTSPITLSSWPPNAPEACPAGIDHCIVFFHPPGPPEGLPTHAVTGGCYDPMAALTLENGVTCDGEGFGVALDGSFAYACCEGDSCNHNELVRRSMDQVNQYLSPDCSSDLAHECIEKYTSTYGCFVDSLKLPIEDECAPFVRPLVGCLEVECSAPCNCDGPEPPRDSCMERCDKLEDDFNTPGCASLWPGDDQCDPICMDGDSLFDGGDCLGARPTSRFEIHRMLASLDTDRSGTVSFEELRSFSSTTPEHFKMFDLIGHGDGLDLQELFLFVATTNFKSLEELFQPDGHPQAPVWGIAQDILGFGDWDQDSVLQAQEAMMTYGITRDEYSWINNLGEEPDPEEVSFPHIAGILQGLMAGLRGDFWGETYDMEMAMRVLVKFADYDRNGEMTMAEAYLLRISSTMFRQIDVDMSKGISAGELEAVLRTIGNGMCVGLKIIDQTDVAVIGQLPLILPSECKILILPGWSYPKEFEPHGMPMCNATNFERNQAPPTLNVRAHKKGMWKTSSQRGDARGVVMTRSLNTENHDTKHLSRQRAASPRSKTEPSSLPKARTSKGNKRAVGPRPSEGKARIDSKGFRPRSNPARKPSPLHRHGVSTRIIGGEDTDPLEFPFVVAIETRSNPTPGSGSGSGSGPGSNLGSGSNSGPGSNLGSGLNSSNAISSNSGLGSGSGSAAGSAPGEPFEEESGTFCTGTLIHPEWVLTAAHCVFGNEEHVVLNDVVTVGVHADLGAKTLMDGKGCQEQFDIERVLVHPGYDEATSQYDVALIKLRGASTYPPVELYDGGDLMYSQCKKLAPIAVGWGQTDLQDQDSFAGVLQHVTVQPVTPEACMDEWFTQKGYQMVYPDTMMCMRSPEDDVAMGTCNGDSGGPLLAPFPQSATGWVQIGITSWGSTICDGPMPQVYTRVSEVLQWVLSVSDLGKFPAKSLQFTLRELAIPDGATVDVYKGNSVDNGMLLDSLDSKCDAGMTYSAEGQGAMLVVMKTPRAPEGDGPGDEDDTVRSSRVEPDVCDLDCLKGQGLRGELEAVGCHDNFNPPRGELDERELTGLCEDSERGGIEGCEAREDRETGMVQCEAPKCELRWMRWENITAMARMGKSLTGGLGQVRNKPFPGMHSRGVYKFYACVRDWDIAEQLACGVRPREFACFQFDERSREFHWYGIGSDLKMVSPSVVADALEKERRMISPLPAPSS